MILTKREIDVLRLIILGYDYKKIAKTLFISTNTVLTHTRKIRSKLGVKNSAGMVREGINRGYYKFTLTRDLRLRNP